MNLFLIQNLDEAALAYKCQQSSHLETTKFIAWTPFGLESLYKEKLEAFTFTELQSDMPMQADLFCEFEQFRLWCSRLDHHVSATFPEANQYGLRLFSNKLSQLRLLFYIFFNDIDKLAFIIKKEKPKKIYYFSYPDPYAILSRIIDAIQRQNSWEMEFIALNPHSPYRATHPLDKIVPTGYVPHNPLRNLAKILLRRSSGKRLKSTLSALMRLTTRKPSLLVINDQGSEETFKQILLENEVSLYHWEDFYLRNTTKLDAGCIKNCLQRIDNDTSLRTWTSRHRVDLFSIFRKEIEETLRVDLPIALKTIKNFAKIHRQYKFSMVLSTFETLYCGVIFDYCEQLHIPTKLLLHGGTVGLIKDFPLLNIGIRGLQKNSHLSYLVYSDAIANYCQSIKPQMPYFTAHVTTVQSPYLKKIAKNSQKVCQNPMQDSNAARVLNICYVCSGTGIFNINSKFGIYDDASLYQLRYYTASLFSKSLEAKLTFKFGYNTEDYRLAFETAVLAGKYPNINAHESKIKLSNIMNEYDLFILELPSTTLFELLLTAKPIIVLSDERAIKLTEHALKLLKDRVVLYHKIDAFKLALHELHQFGRSADILKSFKLDDHAFVNEMIGMQEENITLEQYIKQKIKHHHYPSKGTDFDTCEGRL